MFKPLLASDADLSTLRFPLLASPKLDGVRAVVRDGVVYSRSNKPIPNKHIQLMFANCEHFDGELIAGDPTSDSAYRDTVSVVMSDNKSADNVRFYVFDHVKKLSATYDARRTELASTVQAVQHLNVYLHECLPMLNMPELDAYEAECLEAGYEGLILRDPASAYKCGRSTAKEGILLKLKRFVDDEATVIGFEERMHNGNEATTNELGRTKRSSHKANLVPMGTLGALHVEYNGLQFHIGTGFNDALRAEIWANKEKYLGQLVKFKHFPVGSKDLPRHPVFLGWRDSIDL